MESTWHVVRVIIGNLACRLHCWLTIKGSTWALLSCQQMDLISCFTGTPLLHRPRQFPLPGSYFLTFPPS